MEFGGGIQTGCYLLRPLCFAAHSVCDIISTSCEKGASVSLLWTRCSPLVWNFKPGWDSQKCLVYHSDLGDAFIWVCLLRTAVNTPVNSVCFCLVMVGSVLKPRWFCKAWKMVPDLKKFSILVGKTRRAYSKPWQIPHESIQSITVVCGCQQ